MKNQSLKNSRHLFERFQERIRTTAMLKPKERVLVGCSGGPDSVALVYLFAKLISSNRQRLGILHYDHCLRTASRADADFVRRLSGKLKLKFYSGSGNVRKASTWTQSSIEETARKMRYDFFIKTAKRLHIKKIALAHTLDDQAETVLMRILQGTGLRGLQGIREINRMGGISFIRPFLAFKKDELLDFLHAEQIPFRKDRSNDSERFLRNRIRRKLLPMLRRDFNPRVTESLARIPVIASEEEALVDELEKGSWRKVLKRSHRFKVEFRRDVFSQLAVPLQFRMIERALKKIHPQSGLSYDAWRRIRQGLSRSRNCWSLPKDIDLVLTPRSVMIYKKHQENQL